MIVLWQGEQGVEFGVVIVINKLVSVCEEFELFDGLLGLVLEKLGVCHANVSEDAEGGLDDVGKVLHFIGFGNACLENGKVVLV